jgi:hypothetical protein
MPAQRLMRLIPILALLGGLVLLSGLIAPRPAVWAAQPAPAQAGLVVRFGDGATRTACVDLGPDGEATGEEVLRDSGLTTTIAFDPGAGSAVCKIEQEGCAYPAEACFCQCTLAPGQPCRYWAYYRLGATGWAIANIGASASTVRAGAVEGWSWGPGGVGSGVEPPPITFDEICVPPATATPTATVTPSVTATAPPSPTVEPTPSPPPAPEAPQPIIIPVASSTPRPAPTSAPTPTDLPAATATLPPLTPSAIPSATVGPTEVPPELPEPTAAPDPTTPPTAPPEPTAAPDPTTPPTVPPEPAEAPLESAAGGVAAPQAGAGPLWLPLIAQAAIPGPTSVPPAAPAPTTPPTTLPTTLPTAAPVAAPATPPVAAPAPADSGGLGWFLALSTALALALVVARRRRQGG